MTSHVRAQAILISILCVVPAAFAQDADGAPAPNSEAASAPASDAAPTTDADAPPTPAPLVPANAPQASPPPLDSTLDGSLLRIELTDGQVLRATLVREEAGGYVVALADGTELTLPRAAVKTIASERGATAKGDTVWFEDANRTRYFYGPSAMMLKKGQAYFSQKELVFSSFGYGVTDHLNVQVGAVVPAFFFGVQGINGIVAVKGGGQVNEWLHIAGGAQVLAVPNVTSTGAYPILAGFVFGTGTVGTPDQHLSLSVGKPFAYQPSEGVLGANSFIVSVSGNKRIAANVALMTENWLLVPSVGTEMNPAFVSAHAFGARVMSEKLAADIGLVWFLTPSGLATNIPVPWVDFTYNFDLLSDASTSH